MALVCVYVPGVYVCRTQAFMYVRTAKISEQRSHGDEPERRNKSRKLNQVRVVRTTTATLDSKKANTVRFRAGRWRPHVKNNTQAGEEGRLMPTN